LIYLQTHLVTFRTNLWDAGKIIFDANHNLKILKLVEMTAKISPLLFLMQVKIDIAHVQNKIGRTFWGDLNARKTTGGNYFLLLLNRV